MFYVQVNEICVFKSINNSLCKLVLLLEIAMRQQ